MIPDIMLLLLIIRIVDPICMPVSYIVCEEFGMERVWKRV